MHKLACLGSFAHSYYFFFKFSTLSPAFQDIVKRFCPLPSVFEFLRSAVLSCYFAFHAFLLVLVLLCDVNFVHLILQVK